ncbi:LCP family protein [Candidatus Saccharibacteria bacterium]|nr:LCP family protein [Candidatus Saccharibacteria bacterium]
MDTNKSIDGLAPRRSKNAAAPVKKTTTRTPASIKPAVKKVTRTTAKTAVKVTRTNKNSTPISPASKPVKPATATVRTAKAPTPSQADITEDFLKPTQVFNFDEQSGELTASSVPVDTSFKKRKKSKKDKKPMTKKKKIILTVVSVLAVLLIGGVIAFILWGNDIIAKITGGQGNVFDLFTFVEPTYERLKTDENGRTNILAFGTSGYDMAGDEGNGTHDGAQLTDSIMAISINQDTGDIAMLSLPRDLKASPTCTATGKINEVYWCNGGGGNVSTEEEAAAAQALMDEVGGILGMDFQYFAHLNWGSLVQIVDTLGGINVTLDEDILDYGWTGAVFEAGVQYTIDGEQALGLARARHGTSGGDFSRGASQQKILVGIKDKISEQGLSITDMMSLASTLGDNLRTNFSLEEIKSLAHLSSEYDLNNMRQISLIEPERYMTTGTINGISYVLPSSGVGNYTGIQNFVAKMLSNDPRVYEDPTILVLNGTEEVGIASNEKATLEEDGYNRIDVADAPTSDYTDKYTLYVLDDTTKGTKKMLEEKYSVTAKSYDELAEGISRDYNFVLILGNESSDNNKE